MLIISFVLPPIAQSLYTWVLCEHLWDRQIAPKQALFTFAKEKLNKELQRKRDWERKKIKIFAPFIPLSTLFLFLCSFVHAKRFDHFIYSWNISWRVNLYRTINICFPELLNISLVVTPKYTDVLKFARN